jgi:hypothetical protein
MNGERDVVECGDALAVVLVLGEFYAFDDWWHDGVPCLS